MADPASPGAARVATPGALRVGDVVERLEIEDAWIVDPVAARERRADLVIEDGVVRSSRDPEAGTRSAPALLVIPGLTDLHAHFREPGGGGAETMDTGLAAAAHGGFTTVCLMSNTSPPVDRPELVAAAHAAARRAGSPVSALPYGTVTVGRAGERLAPLAALAGAGAAGFSDDGSPVADPRLLRSALAEAGALRLPIVEHPDESSLSDGAEANEGLTATILGLRGAAPAAEIIGVARAIAMLRQVVAESPPELAPRLHLTHLSLAASLDLVRSAKREALPVTCDVTPHHLAMHEGWVGGDRRWSWDAAASPWAGEPTDGRPFDPATRVNPPLRSPADALALAVALEDGTVDAIATDHAPHRSVDKDVPFGEALPGMSGIETALGLVLEAVAAGVLTLGTAIAALTSGPARVLGRRPGRGAAALGVDEPADLVIVERSAHWLVDPDHLVSLGRNTPLAGRSLPGRVLLTIAGGRVAYVAPDEVAVGGARV